MYRPGFPESSTHLTYFAEVFRKSGKVFGHPKKIKSLKSMVPMTGVTPF